MIGLAVVVFLVAAVFGIYMATRIFSGATPPWIAVILHGLLAASGLVLLLLAIYKGATATVLTIGAALLVIAALGGFYMVTFQLRKLPPPKPIVVVHALAAVAGVVCLLLDATALIGA
ncbi:MAG: hypothetical protein QM759_00110 [Terricaulis sp.]